MYKYEFNLGDYWGDGHGILRHYVVECYYDQYAIYKAYWEATKLIKLDWINDVAEEPEDTYLNRKQFDILKDYGIIEEKNFDEEIGYYLYPEDYITIFFNIVRLMLPDFTWEYVRNEHPTLNLLDGAGYGLFY